MYSWNIIKPGIVIRIVLQWHFQQLYSLLVYLEVKENTKIDSITISKNNEKQFYSLSFPFQNHCQNHYQNLKMRTSLIYCRFHLFALLHHNRDYYYFILHIHPLSFPHMSRFFLYIFQYYCQYRFDCRCSPHVLYQTTHLVIFRTLY